jgi:succinyl-CoA synthetase beta subunit
MRLLEYEAKKLLKVAGISIPSSMLIKSPLTIPTIIFPSVLKSQVPIGGRGKLGGIKIIESENELQQIINDLFQLSVKGFKPKALLAEEKLEILHEYYLSLVINRESAEINLIAHKNGGVEVEENSSEEFFNINISNEYLPTIGESLAEYFDLPDQSFSLQDMVEKLYDCFVKNDALLLEINPLILTLERKLIAGDCKMELDNTAAFRHPEWQFEDTIHDTNFVTLNSDGTVATIANGAGLAMATVDTVVSYGLTPANFLDIGGGASTQSVLAAFDRIMTYPNITAIAINIFAGITRCDEIAKAIIAAKQQFPTLPKLYIRLAGTNFNEAVALLQKEGIPTLPTLEACLELVKKEGTL